MRFLLALPLAVLAAAPASAASADPLAPAPALGLAATDRAQVQSLFRRWEKAWADGDAVAWSRLFHEDGVWVLWTGGEWRSRRQIAREFAAPLATVYKDSVQLVREVELTRLAPNVIVARIRTTTTGDTRQPGVTIHGNKMLVLTRKAGGPWLVQFGQNTRLNDAEIAKLK